MVPASPLVIQAFLHRAAVDIEVVALAACIIDRLSNRFAMNWRRECPLVGRDLVSAEDQLAPRGDYHDSGKDLFLRPEIIALASLMLAAKVLDDKEGNLVNTNDLLDPTSLRRPLLPQPAQHHRTSDSMRARLPDPAAL
ncbi:MAG: hypothetical protein M1813_004633 [Trichoglossum hirsutum]|nr:MAG: hypothetical protein M1813_004633 [Trichoglossum hirsutum]